MTKTNALVDCSHCAVPIAYGQAWGHDDTGRLFHRDCQYAADPTYWRDRIFGG